MIETRSLTKIFKTPQCGIYGPARESGDVHNVETVLVAASRKNGCFSPFSFGTKIEAICFASDSRTTSSAMCHHTQRASNGFTQ